MPRHIKTYKVSEEIIAKRVASFPRKYSEEHWNWKGDEVSYSGVHKWVYRHLGRADHCSAEDNTCSTKFEWANKSGKYKRDFDDWRPLCVSHHRRIDGYNIAPALEAKRCKMFKP